MGIAYDREANVNYTLEEMGQTGTRYVNAYEIDRAYGGPEEGGWWFDVRCPISSIRVWNHQEALEAFNLLEKLYREDYENRTDRFSVCSEGDLQIIIEDHQAEYDPRTKPRYE